MAENPNATEPARFTPVIHQPSDFGRHAAQPWHASNHASALATRKQTEPRMSGRQTWCRACAEPTSAQMATKVLTLNSMVPMDWMPVASQSIWCGRNTKTFRRAAPGGLGAASTASRYCRKPAEVKNSDPMKNVTASGVPPTAFTYAGTVPSAKRKEPTANSTPIHQSRSCGAHHVEPRAGAPDKCLRCERDSQRAIAPSGRLRMMKVTNGPKPRSCVVCASSGSRGLLSSTPRLTSRRMGQRRPTGITRRE